MLRNLFCLSDTKAALLSRCDQFQHSYSMRDDPRNLAAKELAKTVRGKLRRARRGYKPTLLMLGEKQRLMLEQYSEWEAEANESWCIGPIRSICGKRVFFSGHADQIELIEERANAWVSVPDSEAVNVA